MNLVDLSPFNGILSTNLENAKTKDKERNSRVNLKCLEKNSEYVDIKNWHAAD